MERIRIIGYCGSGKTYISKKLSIKLDLPMYELDNFVWDRQSSEDRRNSDAERDAALRKVVNQDKWIIEGVHYTWTYETFSRADVIFVIHSNKWLNDWGIIKRYLKEKTHIEKANYEQSLRLIFKGFGWIHNYDIHEVLAFTETFRQKRIIVRKSQDILKYIERCELPRRQRDFSDSNGRSQP
ncbi:MAG TPA: hypothetical protein VFT51_12500 [Bacillales bacterium]|nr:hypothetical protein [Bacillales bacterium]